MDKAVLRYFYARKMPAVSVFLQPFIPLAIGLGIVLGEQCPQAGGKVGTTARRQRSGLLEVFAKIRGVGFSLFLLLLTTEK